METSTGNVPIGNNLCWPVDAIQATVAGLTEPDYNHKDLKIDKAAAITTATAATTITTTKTKQ